ncbi:hypothetical protein PHYSODRAFT_474245, partial [Phytophthora sojae]
RWLLEEDDFGEYLDLVDDFKMLAGPMTFAEYVTTRTDTFALAIGGSPDGRCAFHTLQHIAKALGISVWFSPAAVDSFYAARCERGRPIPEAAERWCHQT